MIILKANAELQLVFKRLIQTMKAPVEWNGYFVVVGDYLILNGRVRSLFFNFENKNVVTNLIDIEIKEENVVPTEKRTKLQNVLNLTLYAFGKWGSIQGLKVEKDYAQLNALFVNVLRECSVEPGYTKENFRFYKDGIRINYEDVIGHAIAAEEKQPEEEPVGEEEIQGLWHKLVWKKQKIAFNQSETTFAQRQKNRLGNNFYMVGYHCPKCKKHLHMVVFPAEKDFRIETVEGGVILARAYTCCRCNRFYTPRPDKLLAEGDVYLMDFLTDVRAYDDYMELLGKNGDRVSNYNFNRFADKKPRGKKAEPQKSLEKICERLEDLTDEELARMLAMLEEGFFPPKSVERFEEIMVEEKRKRKVRKKSSQEKEPKEKKQKSEKFTGKKRGKVRLDEADDIEFEEEQEDAALEENMHMAKDSFQNSYEEETDSEKLPKPEVHVSKEKKEAVKKHYETKLKMPEKLSEKQLAAIKEQLQRDKVLSSGEKEEFFAKIEKCENAFKRAHCQRLVAGCKQQNYGRINRVIDEIKRIELPDEEKEDYFAPLYKMRKEQGEAEVSQLVEKLQKSPGMQQYRITVEQMKKYPDVDVSVYDSVLHEIRKNAEERDIANIIRHARNTTREDMAELIGRLQKQGFDESIVAPYIEKIVEKIRKADEEELDRICPNPMQMTAEEATEAYKKIEDGVFLPELKMHALEMLEKRLAKIKTEECELLVDKLKESMSEKLRQTQGHHFYPARRVLMQEATKEEMEVIRYALDTYGTTRKLFEYPILVVDTSRNQSGKEGMILTPENLYYNTLLNAYVISVWDIRKVWAQTGLLNSGICIERKDGTKIKLPYAVERGDLKEWGECLKEFIQYLQERPDSRTLPYLAREKHETICCFRCGYMYREGNVCPKCGYKTNK